MEVTLLGIVTEVREGHREKAAYPMEVTLLGIVTEVREEHDWKALIPTEVQLLSRTTIAASPQQLTEG